MTHLSIAFTVLKFQNSIMQWENCRSKNFILARDLDLIPPKTIKWRIILNYICWKLRINGSLNVSRVTKLSMGRSEEANFIYFDNKPNWTFGIHFIILFSRYSRVTIHINQQAMWMVIQTFNKGFWNSNFTKLSQNL